MILNKYFLPSLMLLVGYCTSIPPRVDDPAVPFVENFNTVKTQDQKLIKIKELKVIDAKDRREAAKTNLFESKNLLKKKKQELELVSSSISEKNKKISKEKISILKHEIALLEAKVNSYTIEVKLRDAQMAMLISRLELEKASQIISQRKLIKNSKNRQDNEKLQRAVDNLKEYVSYSNDRTKEYNNLQEEFKQSEIVVLQLKNKTTKVNNK